MKNTAVVFDGKNDHEIHAENFFQHPVISELTAHKAIDLFSTTKVFEEALKLANKNQEYHDKESAEQYISAVTKGREILEVMIKDFYGDDCGEFIINSANNVINEELVSK